VRDLFRFYRGETLMKTNDRIPQQGRPRRRVGLAVETMEDRLVLSPTLPLPPPHVESIQLAYPAHPTGVPVVRAFPANPVGGYVAIAYPPHPAGG
jgi:hypothetical protein